LLVVGTSHALLIHVRTNQEEETIQNDDIYVHGGFLMTCRGMALAGALPSGALASHIDTRATVVAGSLFGLATAAGFHAQLRPFEENRHDSSL
jgi:hypothetical protein